MWSTPDLSGAWLAHWLHYTWPQNVDSYMVIGIEKMIARMDDNAATTSPNFAFLEPAFATYRPWSEMIVLAVCTALIAKDQELQSHAIDVLIEGIEDGRAHPSTVATVLTGLARGEWIKVNRLSASLQQIAAISPLHQYVICTIVDQLIASLQELPRNAHLLLSLLLELHTELNYAVPEQTLQKLAHLKGSSKSAKLASKLRSIESDQTPVHIFAQAIEKRIEKAERWISG